MSDKTDKPAPLPGDVESAWSGPSLRWILIVALGLRLAAALCVQYVADRKGTICLFGDTPIYWQYGRSIHDGTDYVVHQWDVPHYALRTPGYPLWLAANMSIFGQRALPIRISQALLGVCMVWWVYRLARATGFSESSARWSAGLTAIDPFQAGLCTLILSESVFTPLLVIFVYRMIVALRKLERANLSITDHGNFVAIGGLQAFLGLVRPSWLMYLPVLLAISFGWAVGWRGVRKAVLIVTALVFGWGIVTLPWAVRNVQRIGRPAISGTWGGATLYDSVRPGATGASDMAFVAEPRFRDLQETVQDDLWKRLAWDAMAAEPGRILKLAIEKQKRFWSPWPNDSAKLPIAGKLLSAAIVLPVWVAMLAGWRKNQLSWRVYVILSPLCVTALAHTLFVGSSRYRMAVIVPALVLAGEGIQWSIRRLRRGNR